MSVGVKSRIERTSRPRKLDIKSLIHRFDLKQSGHTGVPKGRSAADRPAAGSLLRVSPPQLGDVRGEDHDPALGLHVPFPIFCVLLRLLRALDGDRRDDLSHDVVHVDAEDLPEQVLHPLTVHGDPDHPRPPYKRKLSMVSFSRAPAAPSDDGRLAPLSTGALGCRPRRSVLSLRWQE